MGKILINLHLGEANDLLKFTKLFGKPEMPLISDCSPRFSS
jgi:hypothetical protein